MILNKWRHVWLGVILIVVLVAGASMLAGCGGDEAEGKVLKINVDAEPPSLDPNLAPGWDPSLEARRRRLSSVLCPLPHLHRSRPACLRRPPTLRSRLRPATHVSTYSRSSLLFTRYPNAYLHHKPQGPSK